MNTAVRKDAAIGSVIASLVMVALFLAGRSLPGHPLGRVSKKIAEGWAYPVRIIWESILPAMRPEGLAIVIVLVSCVIYAALTGFLAGWTLSTWRARAK